MKKEEKANVVYFGSRERGDGRREHQSFRGHGPGVAGGRRTMPSTSTSSS